MNVRLLSRLKRLETQPELRPPCGFRWGLLKRLLEDYVGERHVVIVERELPSSSNTGQCVFEERPGPAPPGSEDPCFDVYLSEDDMGL
jgi:hypothetical protein